MEKVLLAEWGRGVDSGGDNSLDGDGGGGGDGEDGGCGGGDGEGGREMRISLLTGKSIKSVSRLDATTFSFFCRGFYFIVIVVLLCKLSVKLSRWEMVTVFLFSTLSAYISTFKSVWCIGPQRPKQPLRV